MPIGFDKNIKSSLKIHIEAMKDKKTFAGWKNGIIFAPQI